MNLPLPDALLLQPRCGAKGREGALRNSQSVYYARKCQPEMVAMNSVPDMEMSKAHLLHLYKTRVIISPDFPITPMFHNDGVFWDLTYQAEQC